jgi:putative transcriptional regulator
MPIVVNLDVMLARRKMRSKELAEHIGITEQNVSLLKSGKVKGMRFDTLDRICAMLNCQPGDILEYRPAETKICQTRHGLDWAADEGLRMIGG